MAIPKTRERVKRTACRHVRGTWGSEVHVAVNFACLAQGGTSEDNDNTADRRDSACAVGI